MTPLVAKLKITGCKCEHSADSCIHKKQDSKIDKAIFQCDEIAKNIHHKTK